MSDVNGIELLKRTEKKYPDMTVLVVAPIHEIPAALTAVRDGAAAICLSPL
jgi:DNA-binding NarL/FixJ family response regulator